MITALTNSVPQQISTHNNDESAHPYILNLIKNIEQGGAGIGEIHKINLNTGEESVIYDTEDGVTVTGGGQIDYGDNQSVNIDTEYNLPIVAGDGVNIDADASGKQIVVKVDGNVAKKDSNNNFSTAQTINGTLTVNGDIVQNGETYETHAEQVYTKNDEIITRDGAVGGLASGELTGIKATKYDGTNDGQLGFDANGVARVGDVNDTQPLLTRAESTDLTDGQPLVWDATNQRAIGGTASGKLYAHNIMIDSSYGIRIISSRQTSYDYASLLQFFTNNGYTSSNHYPCTDTYRSNLANTGIAQGFSNYNGTLRLWKIGVATNVLMVDDANRTYIYALNNHGIYTDMPNTVVLTDTVVEL